MTSGRPQSLTRPPLRSVHVHRRVCGTLVLALIIGAVFTGRAHAQQAPALPSPWRVQLTLSGGANTGDTEQLNLNLSSNITRTTPTSTLTSTSSVVVNRTIEQPSQRSTFQTSTTSVANYSTDLRFRRQRSAASRAFWVIHSAWSRATDSGFRSRVIGSLRGGYTLLKSSRQTLSVDVGAAALYNDSTYGADDRDLAVASSLTYQGTIGTSGQVSSSLELVMDVAHTDDYQLVSQSSLNAPLSEHFSLTLSAYARYDNTPAPLLIQNQITSLAKGLNTQLSAGLTIMF